MKKEPVIRLKRLPAKTTQTIVARSLANDHQYDSIKNSAYPIVSLNRLDFSKLIFYVQNEDQQRNGIDLAEVVSGDSNIDTDVPTVSVCADCSKSFDEIFENDRKAYVKSYEDLLCKEVERKEHLSKNLMEIEERWHHEMQVWSHLANQVDKTQDKLNQLIKKNHGLRLRSTMFYTKVVMPEHNYA